jgi:hypothetical protein
MALRRSLRSPSSGSVPGYIRLLSALFHYHSSLRIIVAAGCQRLNLQALLRVCELRRHLLAVDLGAPLPPVGEPVAVAAERGPWAAFTHWSGRALAAR